jgi:lipopolysaccharide export system protein LptA
MARLRDSGVTLQALHVAAVALALLAPAHAQAPASGFSAIGGDNAKKPINIESDMLEVDDKRHAAIFSGNVSVIQGDYTLRAPRLEVTYDKQAQPANKDQTAAQKPVAAKPGNAEAAADPISSGQIKRIHASGGRVVVTSAKDEQEVSGDEAVYDVKAQKIVMTGKEVILSQKKNVVKGRQLTIDLATGTAIVVPHKGRVQAIFSQEGQGGGMGVNPFGPAKPKEHAPASETPNHPEQPSEWRTQSH